VFFNLENFNPRFTTACRVTLPPSSDNGIAKMKVATARIERDFLQLSAVKHESTILSQLE